MKKILVIFALFCAVFLISCGSDEEDAADQQSGNSDTVTDNESESPDSSSQDAGKTDAEETASDDDTDAADQERKRGELYGECYPNKTCNEGLVCDTENNICIKDDSAGEDDSEDGDQTNDKDTDEDKNDDKDPGDTQPDEDSGTETEPESKKCLDAGGNWEANAGGNSCTKTAGCDPIPETVTNAEWNGPDSYTQTYTGGTWSAKIPTEYNENAGECRYKCKETYFYHDSQCLNPCDSNPCAEVTDATADSCLASSWHDYSCGCKEGYFWHQMQCKKIALGNICTGQKKCYDASAELEVCPAKGKDFYGQDAQYLNECSAQSFTVGTGTQAGTIFDNNTLLTWEQSPSTNTYTWENAHKHCDDLKNSNYGGKNNWRVPNPFEFLSVVDNSRFNHAMSQDFKNLPSGQDDSYFWTSKGGYYDGQGWTFNTYSGWGESYEVSTSNNYKVLCVSGNELLPAKASDLETSPDEKTVKDKLTGLIWQKTPDNNVMTWQNALAYCQNLNNDNFGGYSTGWRMPNKNELVSLLDFDSYCSNFPDMPSTWLWSSTVAASDPDHAWGVGFNYCMVTMNNKTRSSKVLCVRNAE